MNQERLEYLFTAYFEKRASEVEKQELAALVNDDANKDQMMQLFNTAWERYEGDGEVITDSQRILEKILEKKQVPVRRINWLKRIAVAASIIIALGVGSYFAFFNKSNRATIAKTQDERFKNDVGPGKYKAKLTLADGREIVLDSVMAGLLTTQGGTIVINKDGQLVYQSGSGTNEVLYNTLSTAKGETYATTLADGSKVWLNSASSIKFPVAFTGNARKVEITGEAYFEVAKNATKPFQVSVNGSIVEVLGTHFNINAYSDEAVVKTTLLEGSVKIKDVVLKPGEQAQVGTTVKVVKDANLEEVMAWKNGFFSFESADVQTIMRSLARWYDLDVVYASSSINEKIHLEANRSTSLKNVLKVLELTSGVRYEIEGKKVTVFK